MWALERESLPRLLLPFSTAKWGSREESSEGGLRGVGIIKREIPKDGNIPSGKGNVEGVEEEA